MNPFATAASISSTASDELSPCVLQSPNWVMTRSHSNPSDNMSSEDNGMYDNDQTPQDMHPLNPYYPLDHVATDWNGPMMVRTDSQPASAFTHVDHPTSSPVIVGTDNSMPMPVPSGCQSSHSFVMNYTPPRYRGGYDSPYYGSSVLGPPLYGGYNIGSPQTEGDMMMRAYLASRRG